MATPEQVDPKTDPNRKAKSNDPGWKYGFWPNLANKQTVECILCGKHLKQGITRLKQHLCGGFGDVAKCPNTTSAIASEMHASLMGNKRTKPVDLDDCGDDDEEQELEQVESCSREQSSTRTPSSGTALKRKKLPPVLQVRGPMDNLVRRTPEQVVDERRSKGPSQTTIENRYRPPEDRDRVISHIADWFYECGVPFNGAKSRSFEIMIESIGQYGPGLKPPSYHELRVPLLQKAKKETETGKQKLEAYWKTYGCTLMSDGWSDKRGRHLLNFLVNCPEGTYFIGSVDVSSYIQDAQLLFELLDSKIEEIGAEYVTQVVTDNGSNFVAAGKLLMQKRPKLFWTPCAAHCLDLMLEDIGKLKGYHGTISKAKIITRFIYRHTRLLDAMRKKTNGRDLVRHAATRFATSFLTLQSLLKYKDALRQLFVSDDWRKSKLSSTEMGKKVVETVLSVRFWNGVEDCLRASQPLLVVLRIVDSDERPAMPEVYAAMEEAKKRIKDNFDNKERLYKKVINIVERRWESQMEQKLYGATLFLNPGKYFEYMKNQPNKVWEINDAFQSVVEKLVPDQALQDKILHQSNLYKNSREGFAKPQAIRQRTNFNPIDWWGMYGGSAVELSGLAIRILGLCCTSSACERCWSTFEFIHTKKRNRLEHQRLNDLVFVQYNRRLQTRFAERCEKGRNYDPLVLDDFDWSSEWMISEVTEDLVHLTAGDGLSWRDVDTAVGASTSLAGRNLPRAAHGFTSDSSAPAPRHYSRRGGRRVIGLEDDDDDDDGGGEMEEEEVASDDEDVEDDYGQSPEDSSRNVRSETTNMLIDDYD